MSYHLPTNALQRAGFFRELRHGHPDGPSLHELIGAGSAEDGRVGTYLRQGNVLGATAQQVDDCLDPANTNITELKLMTDGTWLWPSDLVYYVETYSAAVPVELLRHITMNKGGPRSLSTQELGILEGELLG